MAKLDPIVLGFLTHPDLDGFTLGRIPKGYQAAARVRGEIGWKVRYGTTKEMAYENIAVTFLADRNGVDPLEEI